jgi:mannose-1-phosphate guanylyltransferase
VNASVRDREWAIVLAAGEGQRLARVTRALYGHDVPKQFAALDGDQTMLQQTMARTARLTPADRTVVVVGAGHQSRLAHEQLAECPDAHLVEQPRNAGTLAGLLLPLAHVLHAAPHAPVVVYPSDHHVHRLAPFVEAVRHALETVKRTPARVVLVGASADRPATDLGWILPGQAIEAGDGARAVECFVEKPPASSAAHLYECGALFNTLVIAMEGAAFWESALAAHPALARAFERYRASIGTAREADVLREAYAALPTLDLSRDFLAKRSGLGVVELADAGWSDCGTPERLFETLAHVGNLERLLGRLRVGARPFAFERGAD